MALPLFKTDDTVLTLLQSTWSSELNPLLLNEAVNGTLIRNVALSIGDNTINHKLAHKLNGWIIVRQRAASTIYDKQDNNPRQNLTLVLNSSAAVVVDLYVF